MAPTMEPERGKVGPKKKVYGREQSGSSPEISSTEMSTKRNAAPEPAEHGQKSSVQNVGRLGRGALRTHSRGDVGTNAPLISQINGEVSEETDVAGGRGHGKVKPWVAGSSKEGREAEGGEIDALPNNGKNRL